MSIEQVVRVIRTAMLPALLLASPSAAAAQEHAAPAQAPGACIAVMAATVTGVDGNAAEAGEALRDLLVSFLTGPSMQPVALAARVRPLAVAEAREKGCAYIVTTTAAKKRSGGGGFGRVLGQAAETASWYLPGSSGTAAVGRAVSAGTARSLGNMAANTRAKDEMRLEWTVSALAEGARPGSPKSEKLKASSDGEDLLSPLVQRAAENIVETVIK